MADSFDRFWNSPEPFDARSARIDLLIQARFADGPYATSRGVEQLQRGELVGSLRYWGARWKWPKSKVERFLKRCIADGFLSRQRAGHHGDVYLVVNYERYQNPPVEAGQQLGQKWDRSGTKDKEGKEVTTHVVSIGARREHAGDPDAVAFARFWSIRPRRSGTDSRSDAEKAWRARRRDGVPAEELIAGAERYRAHCEREQIIGTQFVMQARRFLGDGKHYSQRWGEADAASTGPGPMIPGAIDAADSARLKRAGF
jgi:hypothetical protein